MSDGAPWFRFPAFGVRTVRGFPGHEGHVEHTHPAHAGAFLCSCGVVRGVFSYVITDEFAGDPGPCPRCRRDRLHQLWRIRSVLIQIGPSPEA